MFLNVIDSIDFESAGLADIERLIQMINDLEVKYEQFKKLVKVAMTSRLFLFKGVFVMVFHFESLFILSEKGV
jgi:hypothetical protein